MASLQQIENNQLIVTVSPQGAELQSIRHKHTGLEYMWSGDPAFWGKKSPVLFPFVGGLRNNRFSYQGKQYTMGRHGFARDKEFAVAETGASHLHFLLTQDDESLSRYPFAFDFFITYRLLHSRITVSYDVTNTGDTALWFSVGAHPAFRVPLVEGTAFTDHYLQFSEKEDAGIWPLSPDGLIEKKAVPFFKHSDTIPLTKNLFAGDALVFKDLQSNSVSIRNQQNPHGLTVGYEQFPYMGIWSTKNADFICIEPWCGIADSVDAVGEISMKEGIHSLKPGGSFTRSWYIELF